MPCSSNMILTSLVFLFLATSSTEAIHECCPGHNLLSLVTKNCSTNDPINLKCNGYTISVNETAKFKEFNFLIMDNGSLIDQNSKSEISYCHSNPDKDSVNISSHIYIFCYVPTEIDRFEESAHQIGGILGYVSVAFIILTIIVYSMVPKLLDLQGICMIHALIGLALGYIFLGILKLATFYEYNSCSVVAILTYFSSLYLFFWLHTLSFHIWRTTVEPRFLSRISKWLIIYHVFAIGGAVIFLTFLLLAQYSPSEMWNSIRPRFGEEKCWFYSLRETMIFFYGPISVLLLLNVVFYVWTVVVLWGQAKTTQNKILTYRLKLCVRLFIIMGVTWIFEIITAILNESRPTLFVKIIFFLLDTFNLLQGLLIFIVLVVFRKKVRRALANKNMCGITFPNSWRYLEDEEIESTEERVNNTIAEYHGDNVELKQ